MQFARALFTFDNVITKSCKTFIRSQHSGKGSGPIHPKVPVIYHHYRHRQNFKQNIRPVKRKLKGRVPFDKRFEVSGRHVSQRVEGGNSQIAKDIALHRVHPTGYTDPTSGKFVRVPEMIPEFVVPDLTGFKLKPYVSYNVTHITQSEFTAQNLFESVYAEKISDALMEGEITDEKLRHILYPEQKQTEALVETVRINSTGKPTEEHSQRRQIK